MSSAVTKIEGLVGDVSGQLLAEYKALQKRSLTINLGALLIVLAVLVVGGWFFHHEMAGYEKAMAAAQEREDHYQADNKKLAADLKESQALQAQLENQVSALEKDKADRAAQFAKTVADLKAPSKTLDQVTNDLQKLGGVQATETDKGLELTKEQAQTINSLLAELQQATDDLKDSEKEIKAQAAEIAQLKADVKKIQDQKSEADGVISGYKTAAKKSKWQRVLDVAEKVGLTAVGVGIGSLLHR